jgi:hypothetical protein
LRTAGDSGWLSASLAFGSASSALASGSGFGFGRRSFGLGLRPAFLGLGLGLTGLDGAEQRADVHRLARLDRDRRQHAGRRGRHFERHLLGLELDQRLVFADGLAFALEPLRDRRLGDRFAKRRNADFCGHVLPLWFAEPGRDPP